MTAATIARPAIELTRKAVARAALYASQADDLGLGVLAREWSHVAKTLDEALSLQMRVLKGKLPEGWIKPE